MKNTFLLLAAFLLFGCSRSNEKILAEIKELSQANEFSTPEGLKKTMDLYEEYGQKNTDSLGNSYLYAAALYHFNEKGEKASELLEAYILRDDSSQLFRNAGINLASLLATDGKTQQAASLISEVLDKQIPTPAQNALIKEVMKQQILASDATVTDYETLAKTYNGSGEYKEALAILEQAIEKFPKYDKRAELMSNAGLIASENLKDPDEATKLFTQLLEEYPDHHSAKSIKTMLDNKFFYMSNEEILERIRKE